MESISDKLINLVCYCDDFIIYYPIVDIDDINDVSAYKLYNLFTEDIQFNPINPTEHYYYGIYEEKKEHYYKMKMHYKHAIDIIHGVWMLARYYHIIQKNMVKAKKYYKKIYQSLYSNSEFLSVICKTMNDDEMYGYSNDNVILLRDFLDQEAQNNDPYACFFICLLSIRNWPN